MSRRRQACLQCSQKCFKIHGTDPPRRIFSFFKIMMNRFNTALFIPPKFAETLEANVNQIAHLEDSNGHLWKVKISELEGSLVFQQGWSEFIEDHSIKFGYVLVFKYVTGLRFLVQIFSPSACEETNFSRNDNANHAPMKKSDIGPNPRGESSRSKNLFGTMIEHDEIEKGSLSMSDIVLIERPLSIEENSSCLGKELDVLRENDSKKGCYSNYDELKICKVVQDEDIRDLIDPSSLDLVNFYCSVTISINSQSWLELPSDSPLLFKGRLMDGFTRTLVLLRDSSMKVWPVVYIEKNNCKAFCGGGWQAFAIGNNLEQMDVCAFHRVSEIVDMLQVQIFKY